MNTGNWWVYLIIVLFVVGVIVAIVMAIRKSSPAAASATPTRVEAFAATAATNQTRYLRKRESEKIPPPTPQNPALSAAPRQRVTALATITT